MQRFQILGQSNHAIAILLDCLTEMYPNKPIEVDIVSNISAAENESLAYPFETSGVQCRLIEYKIWTPQKNIPFLIGSIGRGRKAIFQFFAQNFQIEPKQFASTIHPTAVVAKTALLGNGVHISPLSVVAPFAHLGDFVVLNRGVSVGHHTVLSDFVTLNPGVNLAGCCQIEEGVIIGAGAVIIDNIQIGKGSIIGAGSVVTRNIPAGVVAYGNPAKVIKDI
jgi:sugar O-acyltransferase (sialic acid O-acetyltransferase NeuD family)